MMVKYFRYNPIDIERIRTSWVMAFNRSFPSDKWRKNWEWSFGANSLSKLPYVAYIEKNGIIASFFGIIPKEIECESSALLNGGIAVAGFTHPSFQGQGLYQELYQEALPTFSEWGLDFLVAFDNHNSHYPEVRYLNWIDIGILTEFSCSSLNREKLKKTRIYNIKSDSLHMDDIRKVSTMHFRTRRYSFSRNIEFLKWRLLVNPKNNYYCVKANKSQNTVSAMIFKYYNDNSIDIMELFHEDSAACDWNAVWEMISFLFSKGVERINIWSNLKTDEHLQFERMGFQEHKFSTYFVCLPLNVSNTSILELSNWHYRFIDSDVY